MDEQRLIVAIKDAHDACYSEYMNCPWCSGRVGHENEWHDENCIWLEVERIVNER